jgi:ketosteroid isomerase-like protein
MMKTTSENEVRNVIDSWMKAVSMGDRKAILAHHSNDVLMFDFPNEVRDLKAYDRTWDFFYENQRGPIKFSLARCR